MKRHHIFFPNIAGFESTPHPFSVYTEDMKFLVILAVVVATGCAAAINERPKRYNYRADFEQYDTVKDLAQLEEAQLQGLVNKLSKLKQKVALGYNLAKNLISGSSPMSRIAQYDGESLMQQYDDSEEAMEIQQYDFEGLNKAEALMQQYDFEGMSNSKARTMGGILGALLKSLMKNG